MEISTGPQTGLRLCRLPVRPERGQGQIYPTVFAELKFQNTGIAFTANLPSQISDIPVRVVDSYRNTVPTRLSPHKTDKVAPEK